MDIDERTPQELAGINNREEILRFLDGVQAKLETTDKKKVKTWKEKAKKDAEKKIKVKYIYYDDQLLTAKFYQYRLSISHANL